MLERKKEFAVILAFDVVVTKEAKEEADKTGVKIFESDVIYQLEEMFTKYMESVRSP
jgi:translation initiation factor 5B